MPPKPEQRRVLAPFLDLEELERDPATFATWIQANELLTAVAHLAARAGDKSFLVRCLATGVLRVALEDAAGAGITLDAGGALPVALQNAAGDLLAIAGDGVLTAELRSRDATLGSILTFPKYGCRLPTTATDHSHAGSGTETHDFGAAAFRTVVMQTTGANVMVYGSDSAGACDNPMGYCSVNHGLIAATESRYLDLIATVATVVFIKDYPVDSMS